MLSWFKPRCPLEAGEKAWVEYRMRWLADRFGIERIERSPFLLPTDLEFDDWSGTLEEGEWVFDRLCERMGTDSRGLKLHVVDDVQLPDAVGHYDSSGDCPVIRIRRSQLADPTALTATLAHELAHELLLRGGHQTGDEPDLEWTTDLLPVVFGVGLFAANATVRFASMRVGNSESWTITRQGYLPSRVFGYAFALMSLFRYDDEAAWIDFLRPDAAEVFRKGLAFLEAGGDSVFDPDSYNAGRPPRSRLEIIHDLKHGTPTFRIAAMWDAAEADAETTAAVVPLIHNRDVYVATEAIQWLGDPNRPLDAEQEDELVRLLDAPYDALRAAAAIAVGRRNLCPTESLDALRHLTLAEDREVADSAVWAIGQFGSQAASLAPTLMRSLEKANIDAKSASADAAARALCSVVDLPLETLRKFYVDRDPELHRMARDAVRAVMTQPPGTR